MVDAARSENVLVRLIACHAKGRELREHAMRLLSEIPGYDWSGIYRLEGEELVLDAYVGEPTEHERIAVGKGVCGTAVAEGCNQIVRDVRGLSNYLACSLNTRSEIVVLIRDATGNILGQIDVDSHRLNNFDHSDERLLQQMAETLAEGWN
jgi:L-methionine (R)-S-oxide reductase